MKQPKLDIPGYLKGRTGVAGHHDNKELRAGYEAHVRTLYPEEYVFSPNRFALCLTGEYANPKVQDDFEAWLRDLKKQPLNANWTG